MNDLELKKISDYSADDDGDDGKNSNDDDEEAMDKAMDDVDDDTTEVIGQPHPRHQEPPARSPLLSASIQIKKINYIIILFK